MTDYETINYLTNRVKTLKSEHEKNLKIINDFMNKLDNIQRLLKSENKDLVTLYINEVIKDLEMCVIKIKKKENKNG